MILRNEILVSEIDGDFVAVAAEEAREYFHGMIRLNGTGAFITKCLKKETDVDEIVSLVCEKYDVTREKAVSDVDKIISAYRKADLILE